MKSLYKLFLIFFTNAFVMCSCDADDWRGCPGDYSFAIDNAIGFEVISPAGDHLYGGYGLDVVEVSSTGYDTLHIPDNGVFIYMGFIDDELDRGVVDRLIKKRFLLSHQIGYKDTLAVDFAMRIDRCDEQVMKYLKVTFNDSVYFDGNTGRVPAFRFLSK
ncbi:hypothetical protein [Cesiribacter sp. SM1]|uniref:hypothetical protein n=1 Tax=Cesiribacter sp. SM1 TaxID=2861196 RepID=UPI001CD5445C|nr:hypothetical protein [Cesiribacter sp. SM1]